MPVKCSEHRETLLLAGLRRRLAETDLSDEERARLEKEAARLEKELGLD